ncbi:hypothetical protein BDZ94DRAFT_1243274 [Collybia nuda]|uniref:Uncharacterized protein n=1 Tax=Collybia nuda TaxID=64659 RepID=A0A9P6CR89_9AGAR|nr:hypothetical protein BDZ94DRAFT_1243274 [Collybia nuda]
MSLRRCSALLSCFTTAVIIIFALGIDHYRKKGFSRVSGGPPVSLEASYVAHHDAALERISFYPHTRQKADTTAVVLNWSRLPNVVRIVEQLCDQSLEHTIAAILVWNNSPRALSQEDLGGVPSNCTKKVRVYNSPVNLYFEARYIGCAQATTSYCFIQDDDYLIWPEIINTLQHQISHSTRPRIHLLPSHELLSSYLRDIRTDSGIHTSFTWLGYGTIIRRSEAVEFLDLMKVLDVTGEDLKMSDNYFTILSNTYSETWFDQNVELGGGQPFTVGSEGDERNNYYIIKAAQLLQSVAPTGSNSKPNSTSLPYVRTGNRPLEFPTSVSRAPCLGSSCLLETSISLLPDGIKHSVLTADEILALEVSNMELISEEQILHFHAYPPSHAVDGRPDTSFRSPKHAQEGDTISLDLMNKIGSYWKSVDLVFLVDTTTEIILGAAAYQMGVGEHWVTTSYTLVCVDSDIRSETSSFLRECAIQMLPAPRIRKGVHIFRVRLEKSVDEHWCVYEVWLRGRL